MCEIIMTEPRKKNIESQLCKQCNKEFIPDKEGRSFCSKECYNEWLKLPEHNPMFGNPREDLQIKFKGKNNPMYGKIGPWAGKKRWSEQNPTPFKGRHHTEESKRKLSEAKMIFTKEKVIEEIIKLKEKLNKTPYLSEWRMEGHSPDIVYKYFNSWGEALKTAGLPEYRTHEFYTEKILLNMLEIIYDTREIYPYKYYRSKRIKLDVGDYACDICDYLRIERKNPNDFVKTVVSDRVRFKRELDRARKNKLFVVILVEALPEYFFKGGYYAHKKIKPKSVMHFAKQIGSEYKDVCQFIFGKSREHCKMLVPWLFAWGHAIANPETDIQEYVDGLSMDYLYSQFLNRLSNVSGEQ
jgi:hypothetical protein